MIRAITFTGRSSVNIFREEIFPVEFICSLRFYSESCIWKNHETQLLSQIYRHSSSKYTQLFGFWPQIVNELKLSHLWAQFDLFSWRALNSGEVEEWIFKVNGLTLTMRALDLLSKKSMFVSKMSETLTSISRIN